LLISNYLALLQLPSEQFSFENGKMKKKFNFPTKNLSEMLKEKLKENKLKKNRQFATMTV
jgi:hypothetical protein